MPVSPQGSDEALQVTFFDAHGDAKNTVSYTRAELDVHLRLAYACTIHKAQGCEFKAVVVVLSVEHMVGGACTSHVLQARWTHARTHGELLYLAAHSSGCRFILEVHT